MSGKVSREMPLIYSTVDAQMACTEILDALDSIKWKTDLVMMKSFFKVVMHFATEQRV